MLYSRHIFYVTMGTSYFKLVANLGLVSKLNIFSVALLCHLVLLSQKIKMSRLQRLAHYNAEEVARFFCKWKTILMLTAENPNYSASEDDGESDHVETDNESFDDTVDSNANTTVDTTVNTTANTTFSIDVSLETRSCDISQNVSSGEDVDGNDSRNTSSNEFEGETPVKSANGHVYTV